MTSHDLPLRRHGAIATLVLLGLLLLWDASGVDLALARLAGGPAGFAWRDHWLLTAVLHDGARALALAAAAWLLLGIWWPTGVLRGLPRGARVRWMASLALAVLVVTMLKHTSRTSCPWDLADFGGTAAFVPHWAWWVADGGPGHCFPAGHAASGFGFVGGFFALRRHSPRAARVCLWASVAVGFLLGGAQQLRGAHFASHTLWTGWLSWAAAVAVEALGTSRRARIPAGAGA